MILRYSATHKTEHNKVYRLDALDAYNQKLVKKIAVRGITVEGPGRHERLSLPRSRSKFRTSKPPEARVEFEIRQNGGIKRECAKLERRTTTSSTSRAAWNSTKASSSPTSTPSTTRELHQRRRAQGRRGHRRRE